MVYGNWDDKSGDAGWNGSIAGKTKKKNMEERTAVCTYITVVTGNMGNPI